MATASETLEQIHQEMRAIAQDSTFRFLPVERDQHTFWRDRSMIALELAREHDRPVLTCTQIKSRAGINVVEYIGTIFDQPKPSKHRSKRLWKKLRRKTARPLAGQPMTLWMNADRIKALIE